METKYITLSELFKDNEVAHKLLAYSPDEAAAFLKKEYGLEFTVNELTEVAQGIQDALKEDFSDELSSEDLDEVTGGGKRSGAYNAGYYIGKVVKVVGVAAAIGKFAIAVGLVSW